MSDTMIRQHRVLFIDDSEPNNEYIKMMLDIEGVPINAEFSLSAIRALEHLESITKDTFPDAIIVDINMPLMDGFEFVEIYKVKYYPRYPKTKLFITSSTLRLSEIEKAKNIDIIEDFIEKSVSRKDFEKTIFPALAR